MEREELVKKLNDNFSLAAFQHNESGGNGYHLELQANWNDSGCQVRGFHVKLVGVNPLSGEDMEKDGIACKFSFDSKNFRTGILNYHGVFFLRCAALLDDGTEVVFREQELKLNCPSNKPFISYTVDKTGRFQLVTIRSNCWNRCRGKVWACFDGHEQCIDLPAGDDRVVRFYLNANGSVKLKTQDETIAL